jgi:hypothetical protein
MLRYEGWMLIPLLGVLLRKKPRLTIVFVAASMLHPTFWMIGNAVHHGDPLYSIHWASNWELNLMGSNEDLGPWEIARRIVFYPTMTLLGMTPILGVTCLLGAALSVRKRERYAVWIIPCLGLLLLLMLAATRGSLALKAKYTAILGTLLFPFSAEVYRRARVDSFRRGRTLLIGLLLAGSVIVFWSPPFINCAQFVPYFYLPPVRSVPQMKEQKSMRKISAMVNASLVSPDDGYISDFWGWGRSACTAWLTRMHPDQVFKAPGAPHAKLDIDGLASFVEAYPAGTLALSRGSRFERAIGFSDAGTAAIGEVSLSTRKSGSVRLRRSKFVVYRYVTAGRSGEE